MCNLGAWFDSHMTMNSHIGKVFINPFRRLCNIRQIRKFLLEETTKILMHSFVASHTDYCNSLLYGLSCYVFRLIEERITDAKDGGSTTTLY